MRVIKCGNCQHWSKKKKQWCRAPVPISVDSQFLGKFNTTENVRKDCKVFKGKDPTRMSTAH